MKKTTICIISLAILFSGFIAYFIMKREDSKPHPILDWSKRIMGGTYRGKWVGRGDMAKLLRGDEKYRLYSQVRCLGFFRGGKPIEDEYISGDKGYRIEIRGAADKTLLESAFAVSGDWNALPRIPIRQKRASGPTRRFVLGFLQRKGISEAPVQIKSQIVIDLDHDGVKERLVTASDISPDMIDAFCNGTDIDRSGLYSLIILQKEVRGRVKNTVVAESYRELVVNDVEFVADTNGDGKMEFMINAEDIEALPVEGFSTRVQTLYEIHDRRIRKAFSNFACPI